MESREPYCVPVTSIPALPTLPPMTSATAFALVEKIAQEYSLLVFGDGDALLIVRP